MSRSAAPVAAVAGVLAVLAWRQSRRISQLNTRVRVQNEAAMDRTVTHGIELFNLEADHAVEVDHLRGEIKLLCAELEVHANEIHRLMADADDQMQERAS